MTRSSTDHTPSDSPTSHRALVWTNGTRRQDTWNLALVRSPSRELGTAGQGHLGLPLTVDFRLTWSRLEVTKSST
eukprot:5330361-Amphidinium_carterae.1